MDSYRRPKDRNSGQIECFKCLRVGHAARNCERLTAKERLYDIDRVQTGIKLELYSKFTNVRVTCPNFICSRCEAIARAADEAKKRGSYARNEEVPNCGCIEPKPKPETSPIDEFKDLQLDRELVENIVDTERCNFKAPTPIQRYALPIITDGYDVMGCAQTGTGKTAAYIIPMVKFIKENGFRKKSVKEGEPQKPEVLILAPTRELASQIAKTTRKLTYDFDPSCGVCLVFGGQSKKGRKKQQTIIQKGCNILIGSAGRVLQLMNNYTITLENIKFFVLDEADKMLDMGFGPEIDIIIDEQKTFITPKNRRQSLLFSATFRDDLREVAKKSLKEDYRLIEAGDIGSAQPNVEQKFVLIDDTNDDRPTNGDNQRKNQKLWSLKRLLFKLMLRGEKSYCQPEKCQGSNDDADDDTGESDKNNVGENQDEEGVDKVEREDEEEKKEKDEECICWRDKIDYVPNFRDYLLHMLGGCSRLKILIFVETKRAAKKIASSVKVYLHDQLIGRFNSRFEDDDDDDDYKDDDHNVDEDVYDDEDADKDDDEDTDEEEDKFGATYMSSNRKQSKRKKYMNQFKDGVYPIMVSTNVLARGIDIEGVTHVINFDLPLNLQNLKKIRDHDD